MNSERPLSRRARNLTLAAFAIFLAAWPLFTPIAPLQDQMDWLVQAKIIAQPHDPAWAQDYDIAWRPVPNMLGEAAIGLLAKAVPIFRAAALAYAAYIVLFIAALAYFLRADGRDRPFAELLGPMYAVNHFFLMGFFNFALGLAFVLLAVGWLRRRGAAAKAGGWLCFAALATAIYLSHFLAFVMLGIVCLVWAAWTFRADLRRWLPLALAFVPALVGLVWYVHARSGEFKSVYAFHNLLYYIWFQVGPWAPASSYYPLTPNGAVWINATINALTILAVPLVVAVGALRRRFDRGQPWLYAAGLLILIGMILPSQLYEVVRPGQRFIFLGLLLAPLAVTSPAPARPRRYWVLTGLLAALLAWNCAWWTQAARQTKQDAAVLDRFVDAKARVLNIADSHFHFREGRPYREKAVDPYSFPNSVNPYRYLGYYPIVERGGWLGALFGTGVIRVKEPRLLPAVNLVENLERPELGGQYSHIVATGEPGNLKIIQTHASALFDTDYLGKWLLVMRRKEPAPPAAR